MDSSCPAVLLVEDEALIAMAEQMMLEKNAFSVTTAKDGETAVALCAEQGFDVVLMDIDLGGRGMDGTAAARRILRDQDIPIVFLTSHAESEMVERVQGISGYGYVLKDSGEFVLLQSLRMALKLHGAHRELKDRENRYFALFDTFSHPITIYDAAGTIVDLNAAGLHGLERTREEVVGHPLRDIVPDMHEVTVQRISLCLATQEQACYRDRITLPDGSSQSFESVFVPLDRIDGGTRRLVQVISSRVSGQETADSIADLKMAQQIAKIGHWQYDPATETITWSEEVYRMYGRAVEDGPLLLRDYEQLGSAETLARLRESFRLAVAEGRPYDIVIRLEFPHRGTRWLRSICEPDTRPGPAGHFLRGVVQDVTEQMEVQRALETERAILQHAEVLANVGAWEWDMLNDRWSLSSQWCSLHGVESGQFSTEALLSLAHPKDVEAVQEAITQARKHGDAYDIEHRIVRADNGEVRIMRAVGEVDRSPVDGRPIRMFGIAQDITAYRQAEQELRRSLGENQRLMHELNHRVKNNLALVASMIRLRQRQSGDEVDLSDLASRVDAIMIVHQQLQPTDSVARIPVGTYLTSLLSVVFEQWSGPPVETVVNVGPVSLCPKTVTTLGLIINELATNAIKYGFPDDPHPRFSVIGGAADGGATLTLQVENSGAPFPPGLGLAGATTLGLRLVVDLTDQLNGTVDLQRSPHPVFTLQFPVGDCGGGPD